VAREVSKFFEEYQRGTASEVRAHYEQHPPKGEIVLIVEGKSA
jgi:16S rRNA (cytidine1402-2'-O)-methyltransferase